LSSPLYVDCRTIRCP